ncbi:MAG: aquaporin family protein [Chlamydiae bacterium]|nr:aquaporin family protein [Chlamydiota bacterium]
MSIFVGEFIGTMLLILLGNGVVANTLLADSKAQNGGWIVISSAWGFAVMVPVFVVGWISGAHLNPAVTISLCFIGKSNWFLLPNYFLGQMLGAMAGATLVWLFFKPHWRRTQDTGKKLSCFCTQPAIRNSFWNFIAEMIATFVLLLGILGILDHHNEIGAGVGPIAIGFLVFSLLLSLGGATGVAINPARDLGPRIMHAILPIQGKGDSDWGYSWIPVLAPIIGGTLGAVCYKYLLSGMHPLKAFIE